MTKFLAITLTGFCFLANAARANTDTFKVAVVDMQKSIQTVDAGKKARADFEGQLNKAKADLKKEEDEIKKLSEELQKQSSVLNDSMRMKKQQELQQRYAKYQERAVGQQQELQRKEQTLTEPIVKKLREVIKEIAAKKGYKLVIEKNDNNVLYFQDQDDLTAEVIGGFNGKK